MIDRGMGISAVELNERTADLLLSSDCTKEKQTVTAVSVCYISHGLMMIVAGSSMIIMNVIMIID